MYIPKLAIQNFRIIVNAVFDWTGTPLIFVRGKKFAGKSSIGQALSMILASTTDGLDAQGRGFELKINYRESKAVLSAHIQGKHLIERSVTLNTNTTGRTSRSICIDDPDWHPLPFDNYLARYKDAFTVAFNTDYFINLGEKEQKSLLAKLVLPERYDFPNDKIAAVEKAIGPGVVMFSGEPFAAIELAYKKLYKEREQVNRTVKEFVIPQAIQIASGIDSDSLQKRLGEAKTKRQQILAQKDEAVRKANEIEIKRSALSATLDSMRADVTRGEARLATLQALLLSEEQLQKFKAVAAQADHLKQLKDNHAGVLAGIRLATAQINRLQDISEKGTTCPTCDQAIDSAKSAALIEELKKELDHADKRIQEFDKQIEAIGDVPTALSAIQKHDAAVTEKAGLEALIQETIKNGKAKRAERDALGDKIDAAAPFAQPLVDIDAHINSLTEQLRPVIAAEERKKDIAEKTEQLAQLQAKAKTIDGLVNYFGKDGIKATLIADYIGQFEKSILDVMGICGYKCALTLEPFDFHVETSRGYSGPVKELSGAEKKMFSATLQCAVAIASGINVVVIDEMQELGDDLLALFYPKIFALIQDRKLEQAILIGYSSDKSVPKQQAPGSAYYWVEDGNVTLLGKKVVQ